MTEYIIKVGFWLHAYDSVTIEAESDTAAIEAAKTAARQMMDSRAYPEHIDTDERREGIIGYIDRVTPSRRDLIAELVEFDDDRLHPLEGPPNGPIISEPKP